MVSLWLPVVVYMAAIFIVSGMPQPPTLEDIPDVDLHATAYFGLMLFVLRALARGLWSRVTLGTLTGAWIITVLYGASDEWHQMYVPNRYAELRDLGADAVGALLAAVVAVAVGAARRRRRA